ncbi:methylglyoxal synthase [Marinococcus halophilus]|uniref:Methylglyoxal synthase n=1 Tax=Marinococcus halophilus TaxID=1371 RepID=A0A510Y520_MARHA|nr:methylglyoxal synthase [Marinococcus halophilus]OZT80829.1 methylglyoxal synthase [Marinococcus halophilus]GEK57881.1 methylglyoxal synthase [Marinococcus halophilus]
MNIALIAHDKKKDDLIRFAEAYRHILERHTLSATGTTGGRLQKEAGLHVKQYQSGPLGGDQQIGAKIAEQQVDLVLFFRDPLTAQPHEPDITALMRLADVHGVPLATNMAAAEVLIKGLEHGLFAFREILKESTDQYDT